MTWKHKILKTLLKWGLKGNLPIYVENFLQERTFSVKVNNIQSQKHEQINGIPQGSTLSTLFFNIAINDITEIIPNPVQIKLYADDIHIYIASSSPTYAQRYLQLAIDKISAWSNQNGFKISDSKTKYMCFYKRLKQPILLQLNNKTIQNVEHQKFLGLNFDEQVTWKKHITTLKGECQKSLNLLKILANKNMGSDRKTLAKVYYTMTRSKLDYASIIYNSAKPNLLKKLNVIQNTAIRLYTGAYRTTPIVSLYAEAGEASLFERRKYLTIKNAAKSIEKNEPMITNNINNIPPYFNVLDHNKSLPKPLSFILNNVLNELTISWQTLSKIYSLPNQSNSPWKPTKIQIDKSMHSKNKSDINPSEFRQSYNEIINTRYPNHTKVYTDGSRNAESTSCAFLVNNLEVKYKLNKIASNFSAETIAIFEALKYIITHHLNQNIVLITDSMSVIDTINNKNTKLPIIRHIRNQIETINQTTSITILWVPSHVGIPGNEKVDSLAEQAHISGNNLEDIPAEDIILHAKHQLREIRNNQWRNMDPTTNKLRLIKDEATPWDTSHNQNRKCEVILTRLRTGHSKLTHSYLIKKEQQPICETCHIPITIKHIVLNCPRYHQQRTENKLKNTLPEVLGNNIEDRDNLLQFISESDLTKEI